MHFVGVDVGTGSARAGLFTEDGQLVRHAARDINTWTTPDTGHMEQSTADIWAAVCSVVKVSCNPIVLLWHLKRARRCVATPPN